MIEKNIEFCSDRLKFSGISLQDAENLVKWRSDENIIKYFLNPTPVTMEQHLSWFNNYLKNTTRYDFIIRIKENNTPIGVVGISSIDYSNKTCEINYALGENAYHNKGYASEAVSSLINFSIKMLDIDSFFAEIHENNLASENLIKKMGFVKTSYKDNFNIFEKVIKKIYFRVDGNEKIGTGHIMRCLSIAEAARDKNNKCIFIVADIKMASIISSKGFSFICIDSVWNDLDKEIIKMRSLIEKEQIEKLFVDSYFVTQKYMYELSLKTKVIYIDDLFNSIFSCHTLINYNCYADSIPYKENYFNIDLLVGTIYAPLRKEFVNLPAFEVKNEVTNILITTGGTDLYNAASKITRKLLPLIDKEIHIYIISGRFNEHLEELRSIENSDKRVKIFTGVEKMSELILQCDVAVSAGGSTLYELSACGIPTVMFVMADNQLLAYKSITKELMLGGGNMLEDENACINGIVDNIQTLIKDKTLRQVLSRKMQSAVDGKGAQRIVDNVTNN